MKASIADSAEKSHELPPDLIGQFPDRENRRLCGQSRHTEDSCYRVLHLSDRSIEFSNVSTSLLNTVDLPSHKNRHMPSIVQGQRCQEGLSARRRGLRVRTVPPNRQELAVSSIVAVIANRETARGPNAARKRSMARLASSICVTKQHIRVPKRA